MPTTHFFCVICGAALRASSDSPDDLMECHACSRYVPVPRPAGLREESAGYLPVFPPEVLELSVKFQCTRCESWLRADARWEGRGVSCPDCGDKTTIPRWSAGLCWSHFSETGDVKSVPVPRRRVGVEAATLSIEEIDFLRGSACRSPGAVA